MTTVLDVAELDLDRVADRFWPKVNQAGQNGCWLWTAYVDQNGYGKFSVGGRAGSMMAAHTVSYWLAHRQAVPAGLELDHLCRVRACVNPAHLEAVTHAENSRRSDAGAINAARQRAITHCPRRHPYDEANTKIRTNGARRCRACARAESRARYAADPERGREISRRYRRNLRGGQK